MEQNTTEWLEWRKQGLGASDAPIIMGDSPYQTPRDLWLVKTGQGEGPVFTDAMKRGKDLEPVARAAYEKKVGTPFEPITVVHGEHEWLRASLDGYNANAKIVLEIKCPGEQDHLTALKGRVPEKYKAQLQHQLMVTGANRAHYWSWDGSAGALVEVLPDLEYQEKLFIKLKEFWDMVQNEEMPPLTDRDFLEEDDPAFASDVVELQKLKRKMDRLKEKFDDLRDGLIAKMKHPKVSCQGVKITRVKSKGQVDYSKIPELKFIDVEQYRKPDVESYRVSFPKDESL